MSLGNCGCAPCATPGRLAYGISLNDPSIGAVSDDAKRKRLAARRARRRACMKRCGAPMSVMPSPSMPSRKKALAGCGGRVDAYGNPFTSELGSVGGPWSYGGVAEDVDTVITLVDAGNNLLKSPGCGTCRYRASNGACGRIHTPACDARFKAAGTPSGPMPANYPFSQHRKLYPVGSPNNPVTTSPSPPPSGGSAPSQPWPTTGGGAAPAGSGGMGMGTVALIAAVGVGLYLVFGRKGGKRARA